MRNRLASDTQSDIVATVAGIILVLLMAWGNTWVVPAAGLILLGVALFFTRQGTRSALAMVVGAVFAMAIAFAAAWLWR
jgi:hypothetical protein